MKQNYLLLSERIERLVLLVRGQKVMLDSDLAKIYGVSTTRLNQQIKRNMSRFPEDFIFKLTNEEFRTLMLQNATSNTSRGGRRKLPYAFTEHGAIMIANVLKSKRAIRVSVYVVRAFVRLREALATHKELAQKLKELEGRVDDQDNEISTIVEAIRQLIAPPETPKRRIGFDVE